MPNYTTLRPGKHCRDKLKSHKIFDEEIKPHWIGEVDNSLSHFSLLNYLKEKRIEFFYISMLSVCVTILTTEPNYLKTWYERSATEGHSNVGYFNFLQLVPMKWRRREILRPRRY